MSKRKIGDDLTLAFETPAEYVGCLVPQVLLTDDEYEGARYGGSIIAIDTPDKAREVIRACERLLAELGERG